MLIFTVKIQGDKVQSFTDSFEMHHLSGIMFQGAQLRKYCFQLLSFVSCSNSEVSCTVDPPHPSPVPVYQVCHTHHIFSFFFFHCGEKPLELYPLNRCLSVQHTVNYKHNVVHHWNLYPLASSSPLPLPQTLATASLLFAFCDSLV